MLTTNLTYILRGYSPGRHGLAMSPVAFILPLVLETNLCALIHVFYEPADVPVIHPSVSKHARN